jgi:tryptophan-rich sensory protein
MHRIGFALIVISLLLGAIWMFVAVTARQCPRAALLFVPYGLWVAFATVLNASLYLLNRAD